MTDVSYGTREWARLARRERELERRLGAALDALEELVMDPEGLFEPGQVAFQLSPPAAVGVLVAEGRLRRVPHEVYDVYERVPAEERGLEI